jgi:hypothetical protein
MKQVCLNCKSINSMTIPYGKKVKCTFHKKNECSGFETKKKCNVCSCKFIEAPYD